MIKQRDISRLKRGELPHKLETEPFIIMRERVRMLCSDEGFWRWVITDSPELKDVVETTKETAMNIISRFNMTITLSMTEGQIYELPHAPFKEKFAKQINS